MAEDGVHIIEPDQFVRGLKTRAHNRLMIAGVNTVSKLTMLDRRQLLKIEKLGHGTADYIEEQLASIGLVLMPDGTAARHIHVEFIPHRKASFHQ